LQSESQKKVKEGIKEDQKAPNCLKGKEQLLINLVKKQEIQNTKKK